MEFFLQQEGNLGIYLFFGALLIGLLYLLLPVFAWRIWFWSRQNSRHLQDISTKLELLIREIAPDALPAEEIKEETAELSTTDSQIGDVIGIADDISLNEEPAQPADSDEESFFADGDFEGELSEEDDMDFSMSDEFDDVGADLADSEISDFSDDSQKETSSETEQPVDEAAAFDENSEDDELVMDFDEGSDEDDFFAESTEEPFAPAPPTATEIPVADSESSDFTVEHFESNEEKSFEFEDVDDNSFGEASDTFEEESLSDNAPTAETKPEESTWDETPAKDIWGKEPSAPDENKPAQTEAEPSTESNEEKDFSFGTEPDLGSAFDEPAKEEGAAEEPENVGDVANSFLSDLEDKLNLDTLNEKPVAAPEPPPVPEQEPQPESEKEPEPEPASSHATLFARCEGCGHKLAYKQTLSGKRVRCPACRTAFALP